MAVAAAAYLAWLGPAGLRELGGQCYAKTHYAAERIAGLSGASLLWEDGDFFKEFTVLTERRADDVQRRLVEAGFLVGPVLEDHALLVSVTERRTREEIDRFAKAFEEAAA